MKRILSLVLGLAMVLSLCPGVGMAAAAEEVSYDDPIDFSYSFLYMDSAADYADDDLNRWVEETFNVDIEYIFNSQSEHAATVRAWVYGGTMPDLVTWAAQTQDELADMAEQGLVAALPDGWEQAYPNLYNMIVKTGLYDLMKVDGKTYSIPHAVFCNFLDIETVPNQYVVHYRKDWANELGYDFADRNIITISEFRDFLEECVEKDMSGTGTTIGMTDDAGNALNFFTQLEGIRYTDFTYDREKDEYVWNPTENVDEIVSAIETMREWYKAGLLDPDFYNLEFQAAYNKFCAGGVASMYGAGHVDGFIESYKSFTAANPDADYFDAVGTVLVSNDDGTLYVTQATNHYSYSIFNGEIDEAKLNRILAIIDFFCTEEGEYYCWNGVKGVDWDYDENGEVQSGVQYPSAMAWSFLSIVSDDYGFVNVAKPAEFRARSKELTTLKSETGVFIPYNYEFAFHSSEAKSQYSVPLNDKLIELIMNDADIRSEWLAYLSQYDNMVNPLLEDLNATYTGK